MSDTTQTQPSNLPSIERVAVFKEFTVIHLENESMPSILKFVDVREQGRYYKGLNNVDLSLVTDLGTAQLLRSSPDFGMYALLKKSTLHIGTVVMEAQLSLGHRGSHLFIELTKSEDGGFLPMKLEGGKFVPVQR